jgi:CheY-like chemotaxis protein
VLTAEDGAAALAVLKEERIDLILTDVRMPVMDGVTLVRSLTKLDVPIPSIVFVSGFGDVDRKEMYGLGVEAFFSKPFDRGELLGVLERAVAKRSSLWLTPLTSVPRQSVVIVAEGIGEVGREWIQIGRGGFSASFAGPLSLSKVSFRCRFPAQEFEMTGQGYVRWTSRETETVGIEFAFLDEQCRRWVLEEIAMSNPRSFIPEQ